jgi:hypothetical protein
MSEPRQAKVLAGPDVLTVLSWLSWGDYDYVAARRLLLDNLLVQGTALANTCLEKYLKALTFCWNSTIG